MARASPAVNIATLVGMATSWRWDVKLRHIVQVLPPGAAYGSADLRNHGLPLEVEITCWPKLHHYRLTTGDKSKLGAAEQWDKALTDKERWLARQVGITDYELALYLLSWKPVAQGYEKELSEPPNLRTLTRMLHKDEKVIRKEVYKLQQKWGIKPDGAA